MIETITKIAKHHRIQDIGFCAFDEVREHLLNCRARERLPKNAKSIILFLFPYKVKSEKPENISRYATVPDYHQVCDKYLIKITNSLKIAFPENNFERFIDNSPIPEVYAAACAGLGVLGENGLLINKRWGSWCFIGEIVTDLEIKCKNMLKKCSLCGDCKKACPTGKGAKCLSAVSQQKKDLSYSQICALKDNNIIWGCDICAEVCPLNKNTEYTYMEEFVNGYRNYYSKGEDIKGRAYEWRGEKAVKRNFEILYNTEK